MFPACNAELPCNFMSLSIVKENMRQKYVNVPHLSRSFVPICFWNCTRQMSMYLLDCQCSSTIGLKSLKLLSLIGGSNVMLVKSNDFHVTVQNKTKYGLCSLEQTKCSEMVDKSR
jgi:hypothetical protein